MSTWTTPALQTLEGYLERNRNRLAASDADADEVVADLRRHVEEEVDALGLPVVTEQDVRQIVTRLGPLPVESEPTRTDDAPELSGSFPSWRIGSVLLFLLGIFLPLFTIGFELATRLCAGTFFDPLPTSIHVLLAFLVPAANYLAWRTTEDMTRWVPRWLWCANGVAFGVSLFYAVMFLPLSPFAVVGLVYFGLGLLPLCPLICCVATARLRIRMARQSPRQGEDLPRGWGWAAATPFVLLALLALPGFLTRRWIDQAGSDSPEGSTRAIRQLRRWGSEQILLQECYGRGDRLWIEVFGGRRPNAELARKVYYRVTGQPFNSVPPPLSKLQRTGKDLFAEFEFDRGLGGDAVAGQVKGLSLVQSRLDGLGRPDQGWAYLEWILEFRNDHSQRAREVRAQILLPHGGVVSRLTLWVNGEEREAAFAMRSQVREAYRKVAVQERRDPVLVTTAGPDRILVQCFPVPANGGTMKIRLGITAPLVIESTNQAALKMPCFLERNFAVPESLEHHIWMESTHPVRSGLSELADDSPNPGKLGLRGKISDRELTASTATLRFACTPKLRLVFAEDRKRGDGTVIRQRLETRVGQMPTRIAIVLDGSEPMTPFYPQIGRALAGMPARSEAAVWFAQDGVKQLFDTAWPTGEPLSEIVSRLCGTGGQDDVSTLLQAWEWAAAKPGSVVVWLHGSQPVLLSGLEPLKQRLEWRKGSDGPTLLDVTTQPGPNRVIEEIGKFDAFASIPRLGDILEDLERLFAIWSGQRNDFRLVRDIEPGAAHEPATARVTGSSHVVRLWAMDRICELIKARQFGDALKLSAQYQLVTALTGAVVLETNQQYAAAGLTPGDPSSVPAVPEPRTWMLVVLGAAVLLLRRAWRDPSGSRRGFEL